MWLLNAAGWMQLPAQQVLKRAECKTLGGYPRKESHIHGFLPSFPQVSMMTGPLKGGHG